MKNKLSSAILFLSGMVMCLAACTPSFPTPYTQADLARDADEQPVEALVHYLNQDNADSSVCALKSIDAYAPSIDAAYIDRFFKRYRQDRVDHQKWTDCTLTMLPSLGEAETQQLLRLVSNDYLKSLKKLAKKPELADRLSASHRLLVNRPPQSQMAQNDLKILLDGLIENLKTANPPEAVVANINELIAATEIELGLWQGKPIDNTLIASTSSESTLLLFYKRLTDNQLRLASKRRLVQVRIGASPYKEVQLNAAAVEEALMTAGRYAIPLTRDQIEKILNTESSAAGFNVMVRQFPTEYRGVLLASRIDSSTVKPELLPVVDLKKELQFKVTPIELPITFCGPAADLNPAPCLDSAGVAVNGLANLDEEGRLRLSEKLDVHTIARLAQTADSITIRLEMENVSVAELTMPLSFEPPEDIQLFGTYGSQGPAVDMWFSRTSTRYVVQIATEVLPETANAPWYVVLEKTNSTEFQISSVGGQGAQGSSGTRGHAGLRAMCPSSPGGRGGNGTAGGSGGPGGNGGNIQVFLMCSKDGDCDETKAIAEKIAHSVGGRGGSGGKGGAAGAGGSGTSCTVTDYQGKSQYKSVSGGSPGMAGADGSDGPPGRPGTVTFTVQ